jgi:type IV pilus assembly protein PilA
LGREICFLFSMTRPSPLTASPGPSTGAFTLVEVMIVVVIIGILAGLAIPGLQKIRVASQDKAVLNNARQLASAAEQYYQESGYDFVDVVDLVGATKYVKVVNAVANETYPTTLFAGEAITVLGVAGLRTITYSP